MITKKILAIIIAIALACHEISQIYNGAHSDISFNLFSLLSDTNKVEVVEGY